VVALETTSKPLSAEKTTGTSYSYTLLLSLAIAVTSKVLLPLELSCGERTNSVNGPRETDVPVAEPPP